MKRRALVALIAIVLGTVTGSVPAQADAYDVRVQVGAAPPNGATLPFSYTRFYPEIVRVHPGQTILFDTREVFDLHTVSFWPPGNANRPVTFRADEGPDRFAVNEPLWQRSPCGDDGKPACELTGGNQYLSSGLSALYGPRWRVTVDAPAGTTIGYLCQVHPDMVGTIDVVEPDVSLPSQVQIDAETERQVRKDTNEATAYRSMLDARREKRWDGQRNIWTVLVGARTPSRHVSIMAYLPSSLGGLRRGDAVEFVSSGMGHHSVTFPTELVGPKAPGPDSRLSSAAIHPACDPDDPSSGAPGLWGVYAPLSPVPCPANFELVISPWLASPHPAPSNQVWTQATYHDSGLMWSEEAPESARGRPAGSGAYFPSTFVAEFMTNNTFRYACTVHGADYMAGTVTVG